jgi:predicted HD phosphohydrolase
VKLNDLDALRHLLLARGDETYDGEPVSHLAHALQSATLARAEGADPWLTAAALLHDIGHLASGRRLSLIHI